MPSVAADTHALVWYLAEPGRLSKAALEALEIAESDGSVIVCSAISLIEIIYLVEKLRLPPVALSRILEHIADAGHALSVVAVDQRVAQELQRIPRSEVPDMPDRIIAATARMLGLPLVTRDRQIRTSGVRTIW